MAKSILVVDYDPKRIEATTRPFTQAGYAVEIARDGVEGVEAFARLHPDLVLIEMMLPKRHGFEVCQELRKLRPENRTPVLILGSTQAERYRMQAIGAGANDYVVRPIEEGKLLEICVGLMADPNQDLPEIPAAAGGVDVPLEDSLPDFFDDPAAVAATPPHPGSETFLANFFSEGEEPEERVEEPQETPAPAGPFDLGDLSDDDITARLDAILPSDPTMSAPKTAVPALEPPRAIDSPPRTTHAPAQPSKPPKPKAAPRARLPQTEPVLESTLVDTTTPRRRPLWPIAAVAVVVLVGGFYGWRAMTSDDGAGAEAAALDAADFARVRPASPDATGPQPASPEPAPPAPADEAPPSDPATIAERDGGLSVPPAPVDPAPARLSEPAPKPVEKVPPPKPSEPAPLAVERSVVSPPVVERSTPVPALPEPVKPAAETTVATPAPLPVEPLGVKAVAPDVVVPAPEPRTGVVAGSIVDLAEVDVPPVATSRTTPAYPRLALRLRREGRVTVRLLVDENGDVADATATDAPSGLGFEGAAVDAVRQWRYRPARKDGVPVKVWVTEVLAFKL